MVLQTEFGYPDGPARPDEFTGPYVASERLGWTRAIVDIRTPSAPASGPADRRGRRGPNPFVRAVMIAEIDQPGDQARGTR